jgi:hypothetical protein
VGARRVHGRWAKAKGQTGHTDAVLGVAAGRMGHEDVRRGSSGVTTLVAASGETYTDGTAARASWMRRRDDDWPLGWGHAWIVDGHARVKRERADRTQALGIPRSSPARFTREARSGAARRVRSACTTTVRRLKLGARSGHPVGIRCSTVISVVWDVETVDSVFRLFESARYGVSIGTVLGTPRGRSGTDVKVGTRSV